MGQSGSSAVPFLSRVLSDSVPVLGFAWHGVRQLLARSGDVVLLSLISSSLTVLESGNKSSFCRVSILEVCSSGYSGLHRALKGK